MFSKNQIESIAEQVVQEQGGTKLYVHTLELEDEDENQYIIQVLSSKKEEYVVSDEIDTTKNVCVINASDEANGITIFVGTFSIYNSQLSIIYLDSNGDYNTINGSSITSFQDTINDF